ncbi:MAG: polysaccharide biosynthesis C-terminal domain-containing protein [Thermoplasmata archaeon]
MANPPGVPFSGQVPVSEELPPRAYSLTVNSAGVFVAAIAIQFIGFIGSLVLYKYVGITSSLQALLGLVQLFLGIGSAINSLGDFGLGGGYRFFIARGKNATDNTGTYLVLRLVICGFAAVLMLALAPISIAGATLASNGPELIALGIFLLLPIVWTGEQIYQSYYIGVGNSVKAQYPYLVEVLVRTPLIIVAAFLSPTLFALTLAYLVGAVASAIYCLPFFRSFVRRYKKREAVLLLKFSWPLLGALGLSYIASNTMPFVVNATLGLQAVNNFLVANGFRILVLALPSAVAAPLFPYLAKLHKQEQYEAIREGTWQAIRYTSMLVVPAVLALVIYRVNFLNILTNSLYASTAATPLAILVASTIPAAITGLIAAGLSAIGWRRLELYLTAFQVIAMFAIAFALLPPYGILPASDGLIAASLAVLGSAVAAFIWNAIAMHRLIDVQIHPKAIGMIALSALLAFVAVSRLNTVLSVSRYYELIIGVVLGFAVYFVVLALVGELTKEDVLRVGGAIGLPKRLLVPFTRICWREQTPRLEPVRPGRGHGFTSGNIPELEREEEVASEGGPPLS